MAEEVLQGLRMLTCVAAAGAHGCTQHHRNAALTTGHVTDLCCLVEQGVCTFGSEVIVHQLHYGMHPAHCCADSHTYKAFFGDRGVDHTVGAKFIQKATGNGEHVAHNSHVFAHNKHLVIPKHFFMQGFTDGLADGDFLAHLATHLSLSVTYISSSTVAGSG